MLLSELNILIPYTYLIFILIVLISFSLIISFQLFDILRGEIIFNNLQKMDIDYYSIDQLFIVLKMLVKKKLWLKAINLMESIKDIPSSSVHKYFNAIGYIYDNMKEYNLSSLYYCKAVSIKKDYIIGLQNLAKTYEKIDSLSALSVYRTILKYDVNNKAANKYIKRVTL